MLRLIVLRKTAGLSQSELARRSNLHHSTVCLVENGRLQPMAVSSPSLPLL